MFFALSEILDFGARPLLDFRPRALVLPRAFYVLLLSLLGILPEALSQAPPPPSALPSPIQVRIREVSIGVTVTATGGHAVRGLHQSDFRVFDDGGLQPITSFLSDDDPGLVVLLLETGPGAFFNQANELHAAGIFLDGMPTNYRIAVVSYSRAPNLVLDFTQDKATARQALRAMNFKVGFSELNLVASVCATLDWLSSLPGKKTIILLSSGIDTTPHLNWPAAQQRIHASDVRILAVSVSEEIRKPAKGKVLSQEQPENLNDSKANFADGDRGLRQLVESTGGRVYFPKKDKDFDHAFSAIARSVGHEYRLSIAPTPPHGQLHALSVKVDRPFSSVDFRRGYFVPSAPR